MLLCSLVPIGVPFWVPFGVPFGVHFGVHSGPCRDPLESGKVPQALQNKALFSKAYQVHGVEMINRGPFGLHLGSIWGSFWIPFGAHFGTRLGPIRGPYLVHFGVHFGSILGSILVPCRDPLESGKVPQALQNKAYF